MSAPCLNAGPLLADHWTDSALSLTETPSAISTSRDGLTLVPELVGGFMSTATRRGGSPDTARTDAPDAKRGSHRSNVQADGAYAGSPRKQRKPCRACGGPKEPGRGRQWCEKCWPTKSVRLCICCGAPKEPGKGRRFCEKCRRESKKILCRNCKKRLVWRKGGTVRLCKRCKGTQAERERAHANAHSRQVRKEKKMALEAERAAQEEVARWYRELDVTPTVNAGRGAGHRPDSGSFPDLPARPLADKIEQLIVQERGALHAYAPPFLNAKGKPMPDNVRERVCKRLGIASKTLRIWRENPDARVTFDTADSVLMRSPWLWFDVYDGDEVCSNGRTVAEAFESTRLTTNTAVAA